MTKGLPRSRARGNPANVKGNLQRMVIPLKNVAILVANGSSNPGIGSAVIGDFPVGKIMLLGARMRDLIFTTADADATATWDGDWAVGSAPNANAVLTDAADFDIVGPSGGTAIGAATAKVSPTQDVASAKNAFINNADGSLEINLNLMVDDASQSGDISMVANGLLEIAYLTF